MKSEDQQIVSKTGTSPAAPPSAAVVDHTVLRLARLIGRQMAREQFERPRQDGRK